MMSVTPQFVARTAWCDSQAVIALEGELDLAVVALARRELDAAREATLLVIDLRGLTFLDSSGIHMLLEAEDRCAARDCPFFVVRAPARVHRALEVIGLGDRFALIDDPSAVVRVAA